MNILNSLMHTDTFSNTDTNTDRVMHRYR